MDKIKETVAKQQEYVIHLLDFLAKWLQGHIKGMDKRIAEAV